MIQKNNLIIVIPAYNEESSIGLLLKKISYNVVVVDDCSTDKTAQVAVKHKAKVYSMPVNVGTGRATQIGLQYAAFHKYDYAIVMDGDGQHDPSHIIELIHAMEKTPCDMIIASRYIQDTHPATSIIRILGTKCISWWWYLWTGKKIYDPTSGYRIYNKKVISLLSNQYPLVFPEPEILLEALEKNLTIVEIPVTMNKRYFGNSSISIFKAVRLFFYIYIKILFFGLNRISLRHLINNR